MLNHIKNPLDHNIWGNIVKIPSLPLAIGRIVPDDDPYIMGLPESVRDAELFDFMAKAVNGNF